MFDFRSDPQIHYPGSGSADQNDTDPKRSILASVCIYVFALTPFADRYGKMAEHISLAEVVGGTDEALAVGLGTGGRLTTLPSPSDFNNKIRLTLDELGRVREGVNKPRLLKGHVPFQGGGGRLPSR